MSPWLLLRTTIVGTSLGKTLPGGSTAALVLIRRTLSRNGVDPARAGPALAASGLLSSASLALLLPVGATLAVLSGHTGAVALGALGAAAAVLAAAALAPLAVRHPEQLGERVQRWVQPLARGPLRRRVDPAVAGDAARRGAEAVRAFSRRPRLLAAAAGWASANWLLDFAVLALLAATLGRGTPLAVLPLAYVIAQLLAAVPLIPGGVGLVEAGMTAALVAAGTPLAAATTTVLAWRLVAHWLPILAGLALMPTVTRPQHHRPR